MPHIPWYTTGTYVVRLGHVTSMPLACTWHIPAAYRACLTDSSPTRQDPCLVSSMGRCLGLSLGLGLSLRRNLDLVIDLGMDRCQHLGQALGMDLGFDSGP